MISIAMATYNGAKYIREQIDSILIQTVQDIELVICDDCSTDETWQILNEYEERESRVHIFRNEINLGFKKNFEKVISLCKGDYIALSDQDDIWSDNHLEVLLKGMEKNVLLVCGRPLFVDENNQVLSSRYDYLKMNCPPMVNEDVAMHILLGESNYQGASMLIKKEFFEKALPIPEGANFHDSWFAVLSCFIGGIKYIENPPIMRYRRSVDSLTIGNIHRCPFRMFLVYIVKIDTYYDRLVFIDAIKTRANNLSSEQLRLLESSRKHLIRRNSIWGRLLNIPFLLFNFRNIYASTFWQMFD